MPEQSTPPTAQDRRPEPLTRRCVLRGVTTSGIAVPLLAACGAEADDPTTGATGGSPETSAPATPADPSSPAGGSSSPSGPTVAASDVPVGGGTILADDMVVVTQPTEGEFKAFSARCTHQGCPVQTVSDGRIGCNCHGSAFSVEDGSVVTGPASSPLEELAVRVEGDQVTVG